MNIQEREELDYQTGVASELQNAYNRSRSEILIKDDTTRIKELAASGKHVIVVSYPVYCLSTDAYIGRTVNIQDVFDTRELAMVEFSRFMNDGGCLGDLDVWVEPIPNVDPPPFDLDTFLEDDTPF